jgi:hypothetical protein
VASNCLLGIGNDYPEHPNPEDPNPNPEQQFALNTVIEKKAPQPYQLCVAGEGDLVWYVCGLQVEAYNVATSHAEHSFTTFDFEKKVCIVISFGLSVCFDYNYTSLPFISYLYSSHSSENLLSAPDWPGGVAGGPWRHWHNQPTHRVRLRHQGQLQARGGVGKY